VNFSSSSNNGDLETLARATQILHSRTSCGKGTAKTSPKSLKKSPSNSSKKRQILDGETLTRATQSDVERELQPDKLLVRKARELINTECTHNKNIRVPALAPVQQRVFAIGKRLL